MRSVFQSLGLQQCQGLFHLIGCNTMLPTYSFEPQPALKNIRTQIPTIGFQPYIQTESTKYNESSPQHPESPQQDDSLGFYIDQLSSEPKVKSRFKKSRKGPYKKYSRQEKFQAMEKINQGQDINKVMEQLQIPRRSLLRWKKNGCQRKQGGGRPSDFQMQSVLFEMIINKQISGQEQIREYALRYSTLKNFKASKGWYVKFVRRFNQYKSKLKIVQLVDLQQIDNNQ